MRYLVMKKNDLKKIKIIKMFLDSQMWLKIRPWIYCYGAPFPVVVRNKRELRKLKDKYKGKRCFIMGNGPSLKPEDLELLKGEYCFGQNKIYKIFSQTSWRPTFYCVQDFEVMDEMGEELSDYVNESKMIFVRMFGYSKMHEVLKDVSRKTFYVPILSQDIKKMKSFDEIGFSVDASKFIYDGNTVTYMSMQLAAYMGFEQIYLVGMDFTFPIVVDSNHNLISHNNVDAHFYESKDEYETKTQKYDILHGMPREIQLGAYESAKKYAEDSHLFKIYNSTRGGELEVFERKGLDAII